MKVLQATKLRHSAEYQRTVHQVTLDDPMITIEDVLIPGFWKHHTEKLQRNDLVDVIADNYDLTLRVIDKGIGYVNMRLLRKWEDAAVAKAPKMTAEESAALDMMIPDGYDVSHTPATRWRVRLSVDGTTISRDHKTKELAVEAALDHAAKVTGQAA